MQRLLIGFTFIYFVVPKIFKNIFKTAPMKKTLCFFKVFLNAASGVMKGFPKAANVHKKKFPKAAEVVYSWRIFSYISRNFSNP